MGGDGAGHDTTCDPGEDAAAGNWNADAGLMQSNITRSPSSSYPPSLPSFLTQHSNYCDDASACGCANILAIYGQCLKKV